MSIVEKLKKRTYAGIKDFDMIQNGDKIIVAISGGKDSLAMLDMLVTIQKHSDLKFDLVAVYVVPEIPGIIVLSDKLVKIFESYGVEYIISPLNIPE